MKDAYITRSGTIKRKDNTLFLEIEGKQNILPVQEVLSIHVFSDINFNTDVIEFFSKNYIPVHFYSYYGNYVGTYAPKTEYPSGNILIAQVDYYKDILLRMYIAQEMVLSSVHNMRKTLMQYSIDIKELDTIMAIIPKTKSIPELMGFEANARKYYYSKFNEIIKKEDYEFLSRARNPPRDPINALISFGNGMLYNTALNEIFKTPLDPRISYLHEPFERRFSLNLDLADIFKPLIVDRVIFTLINKNILKQEDFDKETDYCFLSAGGRRKFVQYFDEKLRDTIKHPTLKRSVSYRHLIKLECYKIIKHILEEKAYKGFKIYW